MTLLACVVPAAFGADAPPESTATVPAGKPTQPAPSKTAGGPEADDELLEFLGSVDSTDEDWLAYLSQADLAKAAKSGKTATEGKK